MKKLCMSLACVTCFSLSCFAQQIPNSNFDNEWVNYIPWWRNSGGTSTKNGYSKVFVGKSPTPWYISNIQCSSDDQKNSLIVGKQSNSTDSYEGHSVYLKNTKCSWLSGVIVPAYVSLGYTWATSSFSANGLIENRDFGTWNGKMFKFRPDAISFVYKTEGENDEPTLILYSFYFSSTRYQWTQENVPLEIVSYGNAYKSTMTNRDCNVLGISTMQGGEVDKQSCKRISKLIERLPNEREWTEKAYEIPYESEDTPSLLNIIFSAGEYYTLDQKEGEALHLDNVKLVYFSRLKSLSVNGMDVPNFSPDTYEYTLAADMPQNEGEIAATCLGNSNSGQAEVALFPEENKVTVTVTNKNATLEGANPIPEDVKDIDGNTSHTYTLLFAKSSAITDIEAEKTEENARYFDLQGIEVDKSALSPGLYIKRIGNNATKVIIR